MTEIFYDFSRKEPNKPTQLIYNTLKTLFVLYTFGVVVSVSGGLTFFKKKAKEVLLELSQAKTKELKRTSSSEYEVVVRRRRTIST